MIMEERHDAFCTVVYVQKYALFESNPNRQLQIFAAVAHQYDGENIGCYGIAHSRQKTWWRKGKYHLFE